MGRTNIHLDDELVRRGMRIFKCKSKRELVHLALTELLRAAKRQEILKFEGKIKWDGDLNELRRGRFG